jgi:hypothetical protein
VGTLARSVSDGSGSGRSALWGREEELPSGSVAHVVSPGFHDTSLDADSRHVAFDVPGGGSGPAVGDPHGAPVSSLVARLFHTGASAGAGADRGRDRDRDRDRASSRDHRSSKHRTGDRHGGGSGGGSRGGSGGASGGGSGGGGSGGGSSGRRKHDHRDSSRRRRGSVDSSPSPSDASDDSHDGHDGRGRGGRSSRREGGDKSKAQRPDRGEASRASGSRSGAGAAAARVRAGTGDSDELEAAVSSEVDSKMEMLERELARYEREAARAEEAKRQYESLVADARAEVCHGGSSRGGGWGGGGGRCRGRQRGWAGGGVLERVPCPVCRTANTACVLDTHLRKLHPVPVPLLHRVRTFPCRSFSVCCDGVGRLTVRSQGPTQLCMALCVPVWCVPCGVVCTCSTMRLRPGGKRKRTRYALAVVGGVGGGHDWRRWARQALCRQARVVPAWLRAPRLHCMCVRLFQFEEWKAEEAEAIKRERQKAVKLTKTLELNAAQDKRCVRAPPPLPLSARHCHCCRHNPSFLVGVAPRVCATRDKTEIDALKATLAKTKLDAQAREAKLKAEVERLQRNVAVSVASPGTPLVRHQQCQSPREPRSLPPPSPLSRASPPLAPVTGKAPDAAPPPARSLRPCPALLRGRGRRWSACSSHLLLPL